MSVECDNCFTFCPFHRKNVLEHCSIQDLVDNLDSCGMTGLLKVVL